MADTTKPRKPTRRERERARHRQEILDAACQVFSVKGFRNTTISDISKRSEFSIASIYKHFESKEDIYHSLIEDVLANYYETLEQVAVDIDSPLECIRACIDKTLDMLKENRAFLEFFVGEWRPSMDLEADELARKSMDSYTRLVGFFADLFEKAVEKGEVVDFPPTYLAIGLLGNIFIFTSYWIFFEHLDLDEAERAIIPTIFFKKIALQD